MLKARQLIWLVGCVSLVSGCAWYPGRDKPAFSIRPVTHVAHGKADPEAMYQLGRYNQGKANYREAIAAYRKALAMNPGHAEAYNGLAISCSMQGQHELALQHLRQALQLSPKATHLHNNLGYVHMTLGQVGEAAAAFEQALQLDPENRWARGNVVALYGKMELNDSAATLTPTRTEPEAAAVRAGMPATAPARGSGASSALGRAIVTASNVQQQGMGHSAEIRLVEVAPNVFEFRMTEDGLDGGDSRRWSDGQEVSTTGISVSDGGSANIEVSNGTGVGGMATQVSEFLREKGFAKARLTDRQPFRQLQTEIHYRAGNYMLAEQIRRMMPKQIPMRESYNLRKDIQVRILLGKDAAGDITYFNTGRAIWDTRVSAESLGKTIIGKQAGDNPGQRSGQSAAIYHISTK